MYNFKYNNVNKPKIVIPSFAQYKRKNTIKTQFKMSQKYVVDDRFISNASAILSYTIDIVQSCKQHFYGIINKYFSNKYIYDVSQNSTFEKYFVMPLMSSNYKQLIYKATIVKPPNGVNEYSNIRDYYINIQIVDALDYDAFIDKCVNKCY